MKKICRMQIGVDIMQNMIIKKIRNVAVYGLTFGLASGLVFTGVTKMADTGTSKKASTVQMSTTQAALASNVSTKKSTTESGEYTVEEIAKNCSSSVVSITCKSVQEVRNFFGGQQQYESESAGSGIVIAKDENNLYVATNNHVVDGASDLSVCFNDSKDNVYSAEVKGTDAGNDLAIVAISLKDIDEDVLKSVSIATLGDSSNENVGEQVVAIGNALGYGTSVTSGYISALDREVTIDNNTAKLIQTDAAINPGNSGGALFNMKGEVIGINSAKFSSEEVEGMGYAIPISTAEPILQQLITMEKVDDSKKGTLGIKCKDVSSDVSESYDIPQGVYVSELTKGGAAEKAGIESGDIITEFDGKSVADTSSLVNMLQYYEAGKTVEVTVKRRASGGYEDKKVKVTLDKADSSAGSSDDSNNGESKDNSSKDNSSKGDDSGNGFGDGYSDGNSSGGNSSGGNGSDEMQQFFNEFFG